MFFAEVSSEEFLPKKLFFLGKKQVVSSEEKYFCWEERKTGRFRRRVCHDHQAQEVRLGDKAAGPAADTRSAMRGNGTIVRLRHRDIATGITTQN
jgi:hypothetical protein